MAQDYNELAAYMRAHKGNPLALAKVMVAWQWTSLFPGGYGKAPTSAESVPSVLNAQCGWRDLLLQSLFDEIGIQSRRVNFHDVPFQTNHTATELFIGGKWMFFDATFGIYFERKGGGGVPLSIEEARNAWPDVVVKQCSLPGWQGAFADPDTVSAGAYKTKSDTLAFLPQPFTAVTDSVAGELDSLYFGPRATYLDDFGQASTIPTTGHTWKTSTDTANAKSWKKIVQSFDAQGRLDTVSGLNDDRSRWFVDKDIKDRFSWQEKVTYISAGNVLDSSVTLHDDRSKVVVDNDQTRSQDWTSITAHYASNRKIDHTTVKYDDGRIFVTENDVFGGFTWINHQDAYNSSGQILTTTVLGDDGLSRIIDWATTPRQTGGTASDNLVGAAAEELLLGQAGNDLLEGGAGSDRLEGGTGNDTYIIDPSDFLHERANDGTDTVVVGFNHVLGLNLDDLVLVGTAVYGTGNELANWVVGNELNNVLSGHAGSDVLRGLAGNDLLVGGPGNDKLEGGAGTDTHWGNVGADTFLWRNTAETAVGSSGADIVKDFSFQSGDRISLALIDANTKKAGNQAFTFVGNAGFDAPGQLRYVQASSETRILLNTDGDASAEATIRLAGKLTPEATWFVL